MTLDELLGADGALSRAVPGFRARDGQLQMAHLVQDAIHNQETLVVEAGTGTGKTFAYLAPAVLSNQRVVVSTGTRNLQDQLYEDDMPRLAEALGRRPHAVRLKGRANYVCRYRLDRAHAPGKGDLLREIRMWTARSETGDLGEFGALEDDFEMRARVTSTTDNCLGTSCPDYDGCFVAEARRRAQDAQVVIVNHHLLCADLALRDEGFGSVLPQADVLVVDEAHQLPEIMAQFFGFGVSSRQLNDFIRDTDEAVAGFGDMPELQQRLGRLAEAVQDVDISLHGRDRIEHGQALDDLPTREALEALTANLDDCAGDFEAVAGRGPELAHSWKRAAQLAQRLQRWCADGDEATVRWAERRRSGFSLQALPLDVAPAVERVRPQLPESWILTSATLTVDSRFDHFCEALGLTETVCERFDSPFDYASNTRLYLPAPMPDPGSREFQPRLVQEALALIQASDGGAFVLCTSTRAVRDIATALREAEPQRRVLAQGEAGRAQLLSDFRADGFAVLVATSSFWEGVDVRGPALRLVIIDRLPFTAPDDPLLKARRTAAEQSGQNAFRRHQLPPAVLALKQGAGRLIRDVDDHGVLMIADPRIRTRSYGRIFIASLPPMTRCEDPDEVRAFLRDLERP